MMENPRRVITSEVIASLVGDTTHTYFVLFHNVPYVQIRIRLVSHTLNLFLYCFIMSHTFKLE